MFFGMTIRAEQIALVQFKLGPLPTLIPSAGKTKLFFSRITMMKGQRSKASVISTSLALATFVLDRTLLAFKTGLGYDTTSTNASLSFRHKWSITFCTHM
jgi:hypothetical protein